MRTVQFAALAGMLALAACSESPVETTTQPSFARNDGAQQSVTGHVERDLTNFGVTIEKYSFSAIRHPNGTVDGRFEVRDVYPDGTVDKIKGEVTCFTILPDGQTARVAGVITSSTNEFVPAGREARWVVRDDGEGHGVKDWATDLSWGYLPGTAQQFCDGLRGIASTPPSFSLRGNVQVRP